ncbi:hypothetical protein M0805_006004 [Coniferiporia weirii]|nr:hypothetical protein M0805_006004 [Coniferiporia weirii]
MAISDFLHFDTSSYLGRICRPFYSDNDLHDNIYRKRREIAAAGWSIGVGFALIPLTGGVSGIGSAVASRTIHIAHQKLHFLENEWARRGYSSPAAHPVRDWLVPVSIAGAAGAVGMGIDSVFSAAGSAAVVHAGASAAPYALHHVASQATGQHFAHGVYSGIEQSANVMTGNGNFNVPPPYYAGTYDAGQAVGMEAVKGGLKYGVQRGGDYGGELYARNSQRKARNHGQYGHHGY